MKKIALISLIAFPFSQELNSIDIAMKEMEIALEIASRSSQRVFVEDFTGLN
tara:strand:- start:446 stop:601 length:156 start_codon:yes stop_codon:yes gene_type:complete